MSDVSIFAWICMYCGKFQNTLNPPDRTSIPCIQCGQKASFYSIELPRIELPRTLPVLPSALSQLDNDAFKVGPRYSHVMVQVSPSMHEALERGRPGTSNGFLWDSDSHWVMVNTSRVTDELIQALIEQPKDWRGDAEEWGFIAEVIQAAKADQVDLITFWWHEQPNNYDLEYWFSRLMGD